MVYLYAGLGMAMLAGIMAVFEMGLALTGNSVLPSPQDPYLSDPATQLEDRRWLLLLADGDVLDQIDGKVGTSLCKELDQEYSRKWTVSPWRSDTARMPVTDGAWARSCLMNHGAHRVIVRPPDPRYSNSKFTFYSCIRVDERCAFEKS